MTDSVKVTGQGNNAVKISSSQGERGLPGKSVLNGSGAPSNALGSNGDFYVDITNHVFYGPKAAGVWPAGFSLVGPPGMDAIDLGGGISRDQHAALRQLQHIAAEGPFDASAYNVVLPAGSLFPTSSTWFTQGGSKIYESVVTYNSNLTVAQEVQRIYDTDGTTVLLTATDTIEYQGLVETGRTRSIT